MSTVTPHRIASDGLDDPGTATLGPGAPASGLENALTLFGGIWLIAGLFIDGYAHAEILDTETEDFFTPWHAIFYSGFLFSTMIIGWIWVRRAGESRADTWLPPGYGWAAIGLAVFSVGGIGDGIWHTVFGVETGIDALLSPTHLLLFAGMAMIVTTPLRAFWHDPTRRGTWGDAGGAIASTAIATALVAFFFVYAFGLDETWTHRLPFDPETGQNGDFVALGLSNAYVATAILFVPVLALLRRIDLPVGAVTLMFGLPTVATNFAFDGDLVGIPAALTGAVALEASIALLRPRIGRRAAVVTGAILGALTMWSVWMALTHTIEGVAWVPELWAGQIVMCGVVAGGLALLAFPPAVPAMADGEGGSEVATGREPATV